MRQPKPTAREYAEALYALIDGAKATDVSQVMAGLTQALRRNRQENFLPLIPGLLRSLDKEQQSDLMVGVESATPLSDALRMKLLTGLQQRAGDGVTISLQETVNSELIGGIRLRFGDKLVDHSVKTKLHQLADGLTGKQRVEGAVTEQLKLRDVTARSRKSSPLSKVHIDLGQPQAVTVIVESATELSEALRQKIRSGLQQKLSTTDEILLQVRIVPELIGGIRLRINDKLIDNTIKQKLEQLAEHLSWRTNE
jgi:F0F1-type ATP synthase delta subunit